MKIVRSKVFTKIALLLLIGMLDLFADIFEIDAPPPSGMEWLAIPATLVFFILFIPIVIPRNYILSILHLSSNEHISEIQWCGLLLFGDVLVLLTYYAAFTIVINLRRFLINKKDK